MPAESILPKFQRKMTQIFFRKENSGLLRYPFPLCNMILGGKSMCKVFKTLSVPSFDHINFPIPWDAPLVTVAN